MSLLEKILATAITGTAAAVLISTAYMPVKEHLEQKVSEIRQNTDREQSQIREVEKAIGWDED